MRDAQGLSRSNRGMRELRLRLNGAAKFDGYRTPLTDEYRSV